MPRCKACNNVIEKNAIRCSLCGTLVDDEQVQAENEPNEIDDILHIDDNLKKEILEDIQKDIRETPLLATSNKMAILNLEEEVVEREDFSKATYEEPKQEEIVVEEKKEEPPVVEFRSEDSIFSNHLTKAIRSKSYLALIIVFLSVFAFNSASLVWLYLSKNVNADLYNIGLVFCIFTAIVSITFALSFLNIRSKFMRTNKSSNRNSFSMIFIVTMMRTFIACMGAIGFLLVGLTSLLSVNSTDTQLFASLSTTIRNMLASILPSLDESTLNSYVFNTTITLAICCVIDMLVSIFASTYSSELYNKKNNNPKRNTLAKLLIRFSCALIVAYVLIYLAIMVFMNPFGLAGESCTWIMLQLLAKIIQLFSVTLIIYKIERLTIK